VHDKEGSLLEVEIDSYIKSATMAFFAGSALPHLGQAGTVSLK